MVRKVLQTTAPITSELLSCGIHVHRNWVSRRRTRRFRRRKFESVEGRAGRSLCRGLSHRRATVGGPERLVGSFIFVDGSSSPVPSSCVRIRWPPVSHSGNRVLDLGVKSLTEFDDNRFCVSITCLHNKVYKLVEVSIHRTVPLEVSGRLESVDGHRFRVSRAKFLLELIPEPLPVRERRSFSDFLPLEDVSSPSPRSPRLHVGHSPHNFCLLVQEVVWTEADIDLAGHEECQSFGTISIELRRERRRGSAVPRSRRRNGWCWWRLRSLFNGLRSSSGLCG